MAWSFDMVNGVYSATPCLTWFLNSIQQQSNFAFDSSFFIVFSGITLESCGSGSHVTRTTISLSILNNVIFNNIVINALWTPQAYIRMMKARCDQQTIKLPDWRVHHT